MDEDIRRSRAWPKGPQALSKRMRRIAPALRSIEIEYKEDEVGHGKRKVKTLRKIDDGEGEEGSQGGGSSDERPASDGGDAPRPSSETYKVADDGHVFDFGLNEDQDPEEGQPHD